MNHQAQIGEPEAAPPPLERQHPRRNSVPSATRSAVLSHVYHEFCELLQGDDPPDPDAFCEHFPAIKHSLVRLIHAHFFVDMKTRLELERLWSAPGQTFLGYELVRPLGQGSFGRVFLAREPKLGNRLVAIKISSEGGASEAEILGRLQHANIVPIYSVREDAASGLNLVCMPYLGSATLCDVLDKAFGTNQAPTRARVILEAVGETVPEAASERPQPCRFLETATYIDGIRFLGAQLAEALAFIHERGICHRDLKPSNVLMTPAGTPMLLDFNLSHDAKEQAKRLGGTFPYMSPEQLLAMDKERRADASLLDARADLFSLGVILFELLSGQNPFGPTPLKTSPDELRKCLLERRRLAPMPLREANPAVDKGLARLVERCLQYNPNDRPQSAAHLARELRKGLSLWRRAMRWVTRHPRIVSGAFLVCLTVAMAAGYLLSLRPPYAVRQFNQGVELYQGGRYKAALDHFERALLADPTAPQALFARARCYQQLAETDPRFFPLAIADYQAADEVKPSGRIKACIGYCLIRANQTPEAILYHQLALEGGSASAEVFNNLGYLYSKVHQLDDARDSLDQAIRLNPRLQAALHNRAVVSFKKLQGDPALLAAFADRGQAIPTEKMQCLQAALSDIQKAIEIGPGAWDLSYDAAALCALAARHQARWLDKALDHLTEAVGRGMDARQLPQDPFLSSLHQDPRFKALLARAPVCCSAVAAIRVHDPLRRILE